MDLVVLVIFWVVVCENGVMCVVVKFNCVQLNVMMCIKQLEEEFGVVLFVCDGCWFVLMLVGQMLLLYVECLFVFVDEVCDVVCEDMLCGWLWFGMMESMVVSWLLIIFVCYYYVWFDVLFELLMGMMGWLIDCVCDFEVDVVLFVCLFELDMLFDMFEIVLIFCEDFVLFMLCGYLLVCMLCDVILLMLIVFECGCMYCKYVEQWYVVYGVKLVCVFEFGLYYVIVVCVVVGVGIVVVLCLVFDLQFEIGNIVVYRIFEFEGIDMLFVWWWGYVLVVFVVLCDVFIDIVWQFGDVMKLMVIVLV